MDEFKEKLAGFFGERLLYLGLQGSRRRGEADENSDIDLVVVLDKLAPADLDAYKKIVLTMPEAGKVCGFISGRTELANWPKYEIFQFTNDTKDYFGKLKDFAPTVSDEDIKYFVKISAANLYHGLCHERLFSDILNNREMLKAFYKPAYFVLSNVHYLRTRHYPGSKKELSGLLKGDDLKVLQTSEQLRTNPPADLNAAYELLLNWSRDLLVNF